MNRLINIFKRISPKFLLIFAQRLRAFYKWDKYFLQSWSQEGEDLVLSRLLENKTHGFYVDVGAHHPKRFSNTYLFYKRGWSGINIDAMPGSMKSFDKFRKRDVNIEKPVSDKKQILTYYAFNESALNGFSKELSKERASGNNNFNIIFEKAIETVTLEEILDTNLLEGQQIDFLSIDVEGLDYNVLKSNNFEKHKPKIILIEILSTSIMEISNSEISKLLIGLNYSIYAKTANTVIFTENEFLRKYSS